MVGNRPHQSPNHNPSNCGVKDKCLLGTVCAKQKKEELRWIRYGGRLERRETIWCNEPEGALIYLIQTGIVALKISSTSGTDLNFLILKDGDPFGITCLYTQELNPFMARALAPTYYCQIARSSLEALIKREPQVAERVVKAYNNNLWRLVRQIQFRDVTDAYQRVLFTLRKLAASFGDPTGVVDLPITHDDIASLVGINRVTASRILKQLAYDGHVRLGYGSIQVFPTFKVPNEGPKPIVSLDYGETLL